MCRQVLGFRQRRIDRAALLHETGRGVQFLIGQVSFAQCFTELSFGAALPERQDDGVAVDPFAQISQCGLSDVGRLGG